MNLNFALLLQDAPQENPYGSMIMMGLIIVVFYFFMIRPQQKKAKEAKKFKEALEQGQKVVTIGGIHGKILEVTETNVLLQVEGSKMRVEKSAIASSTDEVMNNETAK